MREAAKSAYLNALRPLDNETAVRLDYLRALGKLPNLTAPCTFTEKVQHYKLYECDPRMPRLVDKLEAKRYVESTLGRHWVTPTLWCGARITESVLRDIERPAVIKPTHASGKIAFIQARANLYVVVRRANAWLEQDHHLLHREWAYGLVPRRLIIEPQVGGPECPIDYKFWVFDGEVRLIQTDQARFTRHTRQFFDPSWRRLELKMNYPASSMNVARPKHFHEMLSAATRLAGDFRFARVDFYDLVEGPVFGEITFWPEAGLCRFIPAAFDAILGAHWTYPNTRGSVAWPLRRACSQR
jgi:hypothetical protein